MTRPTKIATKQAQDDFAMPAASATQAEIDAAHGSTGWNAYDIWRSRVHAPQARADGKVLRKS